VFITASKTTQVKVVVNDMENSPRFASFKPSCRPANNTAAFWGKQFRRKKAGLTQEKLAEKADLSTIFISRVERGKESPSVDSLVKIAKALGVRARDLVKKF
jgi:DNA-binding XRE family transcriptional regulator